MSAESLPDQPPVNFRTVFSPEFISGIRQLKVERFAREIYKLMTEDMDEFGRIVDGVESFVYRHDTTSLVNNGIVMSETDAAYLIQQSMSKALGLARKSYEGESGEVITWNMVVGINEDNPNDTVHILSRDNDVS